MHKYYNFFARRRILLVLIAAALSLCTGLLVYRSLGQQDILKEYFNAETIKGLEALGFVVKDMQQLEHPEAWHFDEEAGLYKLEDYPIHPQVISWASYDPTTQITYWRYPHITGREGYEWVLQQRVKPLVEGFEKLYRADPLNTELDGLFGDELYKANVLIERFGTQYDTNLDATRAWLAQKRDARRPSEATGWEKMHEGVWKRQTPLPSGEGIHYSWHTENPEARHWYVDTILKPEYDKAQSTLASLGEEEAKRQGIYGELQSIITMYEAHIELRELEAAEEREREAAANNSD